ncbi:TetR/AcrR family transcriptional regulator [Jiangella aurantiaca]|uniref:TetR/AcrR family transcriptional regulator n=1 Tax=Jiangella aurantiaca TaxID=2530373 RepID=A0A4V2YRD4_9ACTN|nr:TetR/AcrR family transcriptional regulator [Jiangella aurantiaca]TDD65717.1 TetR/AcrR family transcriptional regulator [Jiangella aurantiaca]
MRADGRRNREALVTAAAKVFAEAGPDAPLDDVARRAGVGNATLYRHFPTRRALLAAVYADELAALRDYAELLREQEAPADALHAWLRALATQLAHTRDLALTADGDWYESVDATVSGLLTAAQRAGAVRPDVAAADLLALVRGVALTAGSPGRQARLLELLRHAVGTGPCS